MESSKVKLEAKLYANSSDSEKGQTDVEPSEEKKWEMKEEESKLE